MKTKICENPVLRLPDFSQTFLVEPYVSKTALRTILLHKYKGKLHLVAYSSKQYLPSEKKYPAHEKELVTILKDCMK